MDIAELEELLIGALENRFKLINPSQSITHDNLSLLIADDPAHSPDDSANSRDYFS